MVGDWLGRQLYALLLTLLTPAYLARLWWRGTVEPGYRQFLGERLGFYRGPAPAHGSLWIHAVSLGETRAAAPLIQALRQRHPALRILLTHGTATGREAGQALLQPGDAQAWLPLDTPACVRRFLRRFGPRVGVLMETEVWPVLLHEAARTRLPMVLASARLSERSLRQGRRFSALLRPAAQRLTRVLAQTEDDAGRLREMGAGAVSVCGNLKYDLQPASELLQRGQAWHVASERPVLLAAVTREGEEAQLLRWWHPADARLLIVPRHPQRFDEVARLVLASGLSLSRRSGWVGDQPDAQALGADVWLGDTLGEMAAYYAAADVALLGGSFEPLGGQNLIEAAACSCPLVIGPSTFNFAQAAQMSIAEGAATSVLDMAQGVATARALIADSARQAEMREAARRFSARHRGASGRMADEILKLLPDLPLPS